MLLCGLLCLFKTHLWMPGLGSEAVHSHRMSAWTRALRLTFIIYPSFSQSVATRRLSTSTPHSPPAKKKVSWNWSAVTEKLPVRLSTFSSIFCASLHHRPAAEPHIPFVFCLFFKQQVAGPVLTLKANIWENWANLKGSVKIRSPAGDDALPRCQGRLPGLVLSCS